MVARLLAGPALAAVLTGLAAAPASAAPAPASSPVSSGTPASTAAPAPPAAVRPQGCLGHDGRFKPIGTQRITRDSQGNRMLERCQRGGADGDGEVDWVYIRHLD
ncbi:hypothetical protein [Actinomadura roseirufa]|uniref:hypothetical protein n=1 Tax=Actinomadura roseirufa TaxID=2094049 RepID=UPI00104149C9|nr:hypothetical protein [Actinomadura roseirufa]